MASQKYILDSDDLVKSSFVTASNKSALEAGALFDDLTMNGDSVLSSNFTLRKLYNAAAEETLDWNTMRLTGALWTVDGDLSVTGTLRADIDFTGTTVTGITTTDVDEGTNEYYTDEKVDDRVSNLILPSHPITTSYDDALNQLTIGFAGVRGQVPLSHTIHVSPGGTDVRDSSVTNYDIADPYATVRAAQDASVAGDTIVVWPGVYNDEHGLFKDGITFYFHPGAHLRNIGATQSESMFVDCEDMACSVYGYGKFSTSEENYPPLVVGNPGSEIHFECELIESTFTGKSAVHMTNGSLRLDATKVLSAGDGVRIGAGKAIIENAYIESAGNGSGINITGANIVGVYINGCQVLSGDSSNSTGAVYVSTGSSTLRIKNTLLKTGSDHSICTSAASTALVSLLGGVCANKDHHTDVQTTELAPFTFDEDLELTII